MKNLLAILFLTLFTLLSCKEDPKPELKTVQGGDREQVDSIDAQTMRYADLKMDTTAVMDMKSWPALTAFNNTILEMKSADTIYGDYGRQLTDELRAMKQSIPSRLNVEPIKDRLHLMKEKVDNLQQTILQDSTDREAVTGSAQQFLKAYKEFSASVRQTLTGAGQKPAAPNMQ